MAIPRPVTKTKIATVSWGIPITDEVNRLTQAVADNAKPMGGIWYRSAALTLPQATYVSIPWDTEQVDTHGFMATNATNFVVPAGCAGVYGISIQCPVGGSGTLHLMPPIAQGTICSTTPDVASGWASVTHISRLNVGDIVWSRAWQNTGTPTNAMGARFEAWKIANYS